MHSGCQARVTVVCGDERIMRPELPRRQAPVHHFGNYLDPGSFRYSVRDSAGSNVRHAAITQILTNITAQNAHHDRA